MSEATSIHPEEIQAIVDSTHGQPFAILGPHPLEMKGKPALAVRAFRPDAVRLWVLGAGKNGLDVEAQLLHEQGFFEAVVEGQFDGHVRLRGQSREGLLFEFDDPYGFPSQISGFDLHLMGQGTHYRLWERMGAHPVTIDGVQGVLFVVWAPNARRVSVVGDFNAWDGRRHSMRHHEGSGLWEIFIPGVPVGQNYKYEIKPNSHDGVLLKADPYAFFTEEPPKTASRVFDLAGYEWKDTAWMAQRKAAPALEQPVSIYEVHLGSWMHAEGHKSLSYLEAAEKLSEYAKEMGFTHVELLPIMEHPFYGSWGYQPVSLFAPTSRFGNPHDLMAFIDTLHAKGIGVILDWVPAHFPSDAHGLATFDGTCLYEHADPREGFHQDWGTLVFNFGRTEVWNFLLSSALFWLDAYHFDGLRVDAVASMLYRDYSRKPGQWLPNVHGGRENLEAVEFLKHMNTVTHKLYPGILTIAEESTSWPGVSRPVYLGGLGFSLKWNMGWMHDVLSYYSKDPIYRHYHANTLTFSMLYNYSENFMLPFSHDEVVYGKGSIPGKMPGDGWQKMANARCLFGYMYGHPGKKHLFMGMEFGQWGEWDHNSSLDWHLLEHGAHRGMQLWVRDLNHLYQSDPALFQRDFHPDGFRWIDCHDTDNSVYSFLRAAQDPNDCVVVVCNFTPVPRPGYRLGVPEPGWYQEVLNSDAGIYGGGNLGNGGGVQAEPTPWQGFPWSIEILVPPLATVFFKPIH